MNLTFRPVNTGDLEPFSVLMDQLSERASSMKLLEKQIRKAQENPDMYLLAAVTEEGELAGSLIGLLCADFCGDCRPVMFVENVVTLEKYRGKGVGRRMFAAIEAWGREKHCSYIVLVSAMNRTGAHAFYEAIGYTEAKGYKKYL